MYLFRVLVVSADMTMAWLSVPSPSHLGCHGELCGAITVAWTEGDQAFNKNFTMNSTAGVYRVSKTFHTVLRRSTDSGGSPGIRLPDTDLTLLDMELDAFRSQCMKQDQFLEDLNCVYHSHDLVPVIVGGALFGIAYFIYRQKEHKELILLMYPSITGNYFKSREGFILKNIASKVQQLYSVDLQI